MNLRPYQNEAVESVEQKFAEGDRSTLLVLPTGTGKTIIFSHLIDRHRRGRIMVLAHREELIRQAADKIHRITGSHPDIEMADERADLYMFQKARVIVSSIQTQISGTGEKRRMHKFDPFDFGLVIVDECFPAGTLVDGQKIESFATGDLIGCMNENGSLAMSRVAAVFKSRPSAMIRVVTANGTIVCTPRHPIWCENLQMYVPACLLETGDMMSRLTTYGKQTVRSLRQQVSIRKEDVFSTVSEQIVFDHNGENQSEACICQNESQESDETRIGAAASLRNHAGVGKETDNPWRKRYWPDRPREAARRIVGVDHWPGRSDRNQKNEQSGKTSDLLQNRCGESVNENRHRNRRWISWHIEPEGAGSEKRVVFAQARVEGIEILERGRDGTFEGVCSDGFVYNLEVENHHNYFAEGFLVHNCHHCASPSYRKVIDHYRQNPSLNLLGVTATPDRADEQSLGQVFGSVAFCYELPQAIRDGWLVRIVTQSVKVKGLDYSGVRTTAGDLNGADLARVMNDEEVLQQVAAATVKLSGDRRTIVFAPPGFQGEHHVFRVSERLTEIIERYKPGSARLVSQDTPKDVRAQTLRDYTAGKFQYLVNVGVFTEGFDEPGIEYVVMARATKSRSLYAQCIGRGTRPLPGTVDHLDDAGLRRDAIASSPKPCITVLDFVGNCGKHKLVTAVDLLAGDHAEEVTDLAEREMQASSQPVDVEEAIEKAADKIHLERERDRLSRRFMIARDVKYDIKTIDPFDLLDIEPERDRGWNVARPLTQPMTDALKHNGFDPIGMSFTRGSQLLKEIRRRREQGLCTYKQAKLLAKWNHDPNTGFEAAKAIIGERMSRYKKAVHR